MSTEKQREIVRPEQAVLSRLCHLQEEVYQSGVLENVWNSAADCFCREGGYWNDGLADDGAMYQNDERVVDFIVAAVQEKIARFKAMESSARFAEVDA